MKKIKKDWLEYLKSKRKIDFIIADPPWSYSDKHPASYKDQITYSVWDNDSLTQLFANAKCEALFLWATVPLLSDILNGDTGDYKYKTTLTWVKETTHGKLHFGTGHWFRGSTEFLILFTRKDAKPFRLPMRNVFLAKTGSRTLKPKSVEKSIVEAIGKDRRWVYLFSGSDVDAFKGIDIDCVDTCHEK
jgi:N6-adenosine-specific RNA methylase IME4